MTASQIWNHLLLSPLLLYCQGKNFEWLWAVYVSHNLTQYHYFGLRRLLRAHYFDSYLTEGLLPCGHDGCDAAEVHLCTPRIVWVKRAKIGRETQKCRKRSEKYKTTRLQDYNILQYSSIAKSFSKGAWLRPMVTARDIDENWSQIPFHEPLQVLCRIYCQAKSRAWCNPIEFRFTYSLQIMQEKHAAFKTETHTIHDNTLVKRHDRRAIRNFFVLDLFTPTGWSSVARFRHSGLSELRDAIRR